MIVVFAQYTALLDCCCPMWWILTLDELCLQEINMHSAVISTYQQRHTSKSCEPSFRVRGVCGNRQRINLVHKSVPGLLALKVRPHSSHSFRLKVENSFKYLLSHKDHQSIKMRLISYVGYAPLWVERFIGELLD